MKQSDERIIIAYANRDYVADSIEDIIEEIATVLPHTSYHINQIRLDPLERQISDYQCKIRIKPGRKRK